ncbi:MAG: outer membrane beta-barrel protein [Anderseniella sp.]
MRGFKKFLVAGISAGAIVVGSATFAAAADLYEPPVVEAPTWTGFWIGAGVGYGFINHELGLDYLDIEPDPAIVGTARLSGIGGEGWLGRIGAGYDYQFDGSGFVVGIFGDYTFSDIKSTASLSIENFGPDISATYRIKAENSWFVGGRLGWLVNPDTLVYGLVGYSEVDFKAKGTLDTGLDRLNDPLTYGWSKGGLTWGGGFEAKITDTISTKIEYRYQDLDRKALFDTVVDPFGGDATLDGFVESNIQTVTWSVNWRF